MSKNMVDKRIAMIFPKEVVQYWENKERNLYSSLQAELDDRSRKKVDELVDVMQEIETELTETCLDAGRNNILRDYRNAIRHSPIA